jgi:hypothetical protein
MNPSHHLGMLGWVRVYICSDVVDFLKSSRTDPVIRIVLIAIAVGSEVSDFFRLLKFIWRPDSSIIAISVGSEVLDFCCGWRYHDALFGLVVPCWLSLNKFLLSWWHVACWSLNAHRSWSVSPDLSHRFTPAVELCWSIDWSRVWLDEEEPNFIVVDLLIVEYLLEELIASRLLILQASLFGSQWGLTRMIG